MLLAYVVVFISGLLISRNVMATLGIYLPASPAWREFHSLSANLALILTGLHFAMHWKWFVNAMKRYILAPVHSLVRHPAAGQLTVQPVKINKYTSKKIEEPHFECL